MGLVNGLLLASVDLLNEAMCTHMTEATKDVLESRREKIAADPHEGNHTAHCVSWANLASGAWSIAERRPIVSVSDRVVLS